MTEPTDLAAALLADVPRIQAFGGNVLSEDYVLAALTAAMDPALSERVGEVLSRLRKADEYEPLGHDGWEAADLITVLLTQIAALRAERDVLKGCIEQLQGPLTVAALTARAEAAEAQIAALPARGVGVPEGWHMERLSRGNGFLFYTLRQDGWRKGEPVMVNDVTIRLEPAPGSETDLEPIAAAILAALTTEADNG